MMLLVSGTTRTMERLAASSAGRLGVLLTPRAGNSIESTLETDLPWACDNSAYSGFDAEAFEGLVQRAQGQPRLLWVVCPDVVGDAVATLRLFREWRPRLTGVPVAFVGQDGQESLPVPWDEIDCFFVGGSTAWKLSAAAAGLVLEAKRRGKLAHMGRVNSRRRMQVAHDLGCDSIDGSSASMFGDVYIAKYLGWLAQLERQRLLV